MAVLKDGERIDDLQYKGLRIIQNPAAFCFGTDAVLLSSFTEVRKNESVVDFCSGSGVIPLLLAGRGRAGRIVGIELQTEVADMAARSVALNGLEGIVSILRGDARQALELTAGICDVVTVNPPYEKEGSGGESTNESERIARSEVACTLEEILQSAGRVLKSGGRLYMIHRVSRLAEILETMKRCRIEPKRLRFIYPTVHKAPGFLLMEGRKNGNPGLAVEKPLILYGEDGAYTGELKRIYHQIP